MGECRWPAEDGDVLGPKRQDFEDVGRPGLSVLDSHVQVSEDAGESRMVSGLAWATWTFLSRSWRMLELGVCWSLLSGGDCCSLVGRPRTSQAVKLKCLGLRNQGSEGGESGALEAAG